MKANHWNWNLIVFFPSSFLSVNLSTFLLFNLLLFVRLITTVSCHESTYVIRILILLIFWLCKKSKLPSPTLVNISTYIIYHGLIAAWKAIDSLMMNWKYSFEYLWLLSCNYSTLLVKRMIWFKIEGRSHT